MGGSFASSSEWGHSLAVVNGGHSLAVVKGGGWFASGSECGGSFAVVVVNEGGGHSLAVVKGLQSINNLWILQAFKWEDLEFFEPAVNIISVLRGGDNRPSLEHSLAVVTDLRGGFHSPIQA